jgi:hypothetical protein
MERCVERFGADPTRVLRQLFHRSTVPSGGHDIRIRNLNIGYICMERWNTRPEGASFGVGAVPSGVPSAWNGGTMLGVDVPGNDMVEYRVYSTNRGCVNQYRGQ